MNMPEGKGHAAAKEPVYIYVRLPAARPSPTPPWTTCPWGSAAPPGRAEMSIFFFRLNILAALKSSAEAKVEKVHALSM